jgi:hypothetical protein
MKRLVMLLIPLSFIALSGCVVAPYGYHRGWYGPRVAVVAPAPVLVVRSRPRALGALKRACGRLCRSHV